MTTKFKIKNRFLSLLLALVLVFSMIPMTSMTAHAETKTYDLWKGFKVTLSDVHCMKHDNSTDHSIKRIRVNSCNYNFNARNIYIGFYIYYDCNGEEKSNLVTKFLSGDCTKPINVSDTYSRGGGTNKVTVDYTITRAASEHNCESSTTPANCVSPTKTTYKQCALCGTTPAATTSGSTNPNNHSWSGWTSNGNGTHTRKCKLNEAHTESGTCSGVTATCTSKAKCSTCGQEYGSALGHSYQYTADGNVITETCKNNCGHNETATLKADNSISLVYDGSARKPLTVEYSDGWAGEKTAKITYADDCIGVGKHSGSVTIGGVTATQDFNISQAQNSWTTEPSISDWTYGEIAKTPNKGTPKFGSDVKVEYKLATEDDSKYSTTVPTNAGNYKVRFSVEGNTNYIALSKEVGLTIAKKKVTVKAENNSKTYGENDPELTWKRTEGDLVGTDVLTDISVTRASGEDAKNYTITASQIYGANPNYDITFVDGTFTINKKTIGINWGNTDFTYNGEPKLPTATATGVIGNDEIGLTVMEGQINAGTGYTATVTAITGDKAKNYQLPADVTTTFNIAKADQSAPSGLVGTPEDIDERENGTITGVTSAMEYRKNNEKSYTAITDTKLTNLADGTYYIRYKADSNHNASQDTQIVLSNDTKLKVTVPPTQTGYTLTIDKTALVWHENVTLSFALKEGYSKLGNFVVKVNGIPITLNDKGEYTVNNAQSDIDITVEGVADITAPVAEITLGENKWNKFWNNITFGLFFKNTQTVTITAEDKGSGVDKVYYYLSTTELTEEQVKALSTSDWKEYTGAFNLNPQDEYIIYTKAVDKANNAKYISSDKTIIIDNIAPVISDIADGEIHYGDTTFTVTDKHIKEVKVDGNPVTLTADGKYTIKADGKEHTVIATDKSGNESAEIKITVITIASLDDTIESITTDNVKSSDKKAIEDVQSFVNGLIVGGKDFIDTEDTQLANIKANTETLLSKIASASAEMSNLDSSVKAYDINKVKSDDKATINELIAKIDTLLNGNNLTDNEKEAMTALKTTAQGLIKRIDDTAKKVTDLTGKVNAYDKDTVISEDKQDITDLIADIDKLLEEDNLNKSEKEELGKVKDTAAALIERIEETTDSSKTDNTDKVKDITSDNVETKDKSDLEKAKDDLEKTLEDYKDNLRDDEKKDIQDEIDRIEKALEVIDKVEKVEDLINKLPDNIAKSDADAIKKVDEAYNALSKYEQSILDKNAKKKLDNAKSALEALNKATNSPATGDNGNIWMWFALLFVSGGGLLVMTAYRRKRKETEN